MARIPPSVRITSDSCSRAISGFSIDATAPAAAAADVPAAACDGGAGGSDFRRSGALVRGSAGSDGSRSAATTQAAAAERAEHEADHREQAHGRREGAALRHGGFADDARARGVEAFLFLGFARALEERLIDVAAGLDVAFEFAKPHRSLADLDALALLRVKRLVQRGFVVAGAGQVVFRRLREAIDFLVDGAAQVVDLLLHLAQRRMQRSQFAGQFGITLARFGILRAQIGDGRRLQRFGNGAAIGRRRGGWLRSGRIWPARRASRPRRGEPLVAGGKLLVADQRVLGADEIILRLVDRQARSRRCEAAPSIP